MTFLEVIQSKDFFNRPGHVNWYRVEKDGTLICLYEGERLMHFSRESLLANDWRLYTQTKSKDY